MLDDEATQMEEKDEKVESVEKDGKLNLEGEVQNKTSSQVE